MYIETDRLIVRNMEQEDDKAYIEMASDGSLDEDIFCGCGSNYHEWMPGWVKDTILLNEKDNPKKDYLAYTIVEKEQGIVIGSVGCSYFDDLEQVGLVYFIGADYRGNGYATEALMAFLNEIMLKKNLDNVYGICVSENLASKKVLEINYRYNGTNITSVIWPITNPEIIYRPKIDITDILENNISLYNALAHKLGNTVLSVKFSNTATAPSN